MDIRAAIVRTPGSAPVIEAATIDEPRADEILVRIVACGVCHTDMVLRDGALPMVAFPAVLGHEGAGVVEAVGEGVTSVAPGDHVVLSFHSCGHCHGCGDGQPAYCENFVPLNFVGRRGDGSPKLHDADGRAISGNIFGQSAFATHAIAYADNVVKVADDVPFELLAPLGCGVQTGAGTVLNALDVQPGQSVAVLGAGAVGLSAVMVAKAAGAGTIAVLDRHRSRLDLARELGATHVATAAEDLPEGLDFAIDTTGVGPLLGAVAAKLATRGTLALVGAYPPTGGIPIEPSFLMSAGRRVVGVVEGGVDPQAFVPRLIEMWRAGDLPIEKLVRTYPFDRIADAIGDSESGATVKPVLVM